MKLIIILIFMLVSCQPQESSIDHFERLENLNNKIKISELKLNEINLKLDKSKKEFDSLPNIAKDDLIISVSNLEKKETILKNSIDILQMEVNRLQKTKESFAERYLVTYLIGNKTSMRAVKSITLDVFVDKQTYDSLHIGTHISDVGNMYAEVINKRKL